MPVRGLRAGANGSAARPMTPTTPGLTGGGVSGDPLRANLALMAPGTALRDGLERILRGRTGALIVLGYDDDRRDDLHRRLPARRGVLRDPPARAVQDGRRGRAVQRRHPHRARRRAPHARPRHPVRGVRHPAPHRRAGRQAVRLPGDLGQPVHADHRPVRERPAARPGRLGRRSCPAPTRHSPPWSATSCAWTRCPAPCPRWRSRTWSPSATRSRWCSASRWSAGSPTRSPATWWSSAPTAGCSPCSSTS